MNNEMKEIARGTVKGFGPDLFCSVCNLKLALKLRGALRIFEDRPLYTALNGYQCSCGAILDCTSLVVTLRLFAGILDAAIAFSGLTTARMSRCTRCGSVDPFRSPVCDQCGAVTETVLELVANEGTMRGVAAQ